MQNSALIGELYQQFRDEDGFIYIMYSGENTFGTEHTMNPQIESSPQTSTALEEGSKQEDRDIGVYSEQV
jgi:hypothetical protein